MQVVSKPRSGELLGSLKACAQKDHIKNIGTSNLYHNLNRYFYVAAWSFVSYCLDEGAQDLYCVSAWISVICK